METKNTKYTLSAEQFAAQNQVSFTIGSCQIMSYG